MKRKFVYRLGGIAVVLALLVALAPWPVMAASGMNEWNKLPIPEAGGAGDWVLTGDLGAGASGVTAVAVAYDGTIYAAVTADGEAQFGGDNLFRSADGGYTWKPLWEIPSGDGAAEIISIVLPEPDDADNLYIATVNRIYGSTDGGRKFHSLGSPDSGAEITSFDVAERGGESLVCVGTRVAGDGYGGAYILSEAESHLGWQDIDVGGGAAGTVYDVLAVALSPDFEDDRQYVAVVTDGFNTLVTTKLGSSLWGATVGDAYLLNPLSVPPFMPWEGGAAGASLAFPANYNSDVEEDLYIQYVGLDAGKEGGAIYLLAGVEAPDSSLAAPVFFGAPVHSIDAAGEAFPLDVDIGDGFDYTVASQAFTPSAVVAGLGGGGVVSISTGLAYTPPATLTAGNACVAIGEYNSSAYAYTVYAGTSGLGGGFARSVDNGANFARTGLMCEEIAAVTALAVSPVYDDDDTVYMITRRGTGESLLWRTTDRGDTWDAVFAEGQLITSTGGKSDTPANLKQVILSPNFSTDTTVFLLESGPRPEIWRSTDNGFRFWELETPATTGDVSSLAVVSRKEMYAGAAGAVYYTKNNGDTWKKYDEGIEGAGDITRLIFSPDYDADETILAVGSGNVFLSEDGGQEWREVDRFGGTATVAAFHPDYAGNGVFFAAGYDSENRLMVGRMGEDGPDWEVIGPETAGTGPATGLGVAADGTVYVADEATPGVFRALSGLGEDIYWEIIDEDFAADNLDTLMVTGGSNVCWGIGSDGQAWIYEDILTGAVMLEAPEDGSSADKVDRVTLSWEAMAGAGIYEVEYDTDPGLKAAAESVETTPTSLTVTSLEDGLTYYWRVRVVENSAGEAMRSNWSETWSFTTRLGAGEWNPFVGGVPEAPVNGATGVSTNPTFAWNAADWATGYEFVLAGDAAFTEIIISKTGDNALRTTVYQCEETLVAQTTYYWKVRGKNNTSSSEWATAVFTTKDYNAPMTIPPTATPTIPEPDTPFYVWVTIGIGTALIVVMVVLILRTRRV